CQSGLRSGTRASPDGTRHNQRGRRSRSSAGRGCAPNRAAPGRRSPASFRPALFQVDLLTSNTPSTPLTFHFGLQPLPDPVEPDRYVVLLELELVPQFLIRESLDVSDRK